MSAKARIEFFEFKARECITPKENIMSKYEIRKATVISTQIVDDDEARSQIQYFVSTVELTTASGPIQRKFKTAQPLTEGSYVEVKYNEAKRKFSLAKKPRDADFGMIFYIFSVVLGFMAFFAVSYGLLQLEGEAKQTAIRLYTYGVIAIGIAFLIYIVVLIVRRRKILDDCMVVKGKLVGYIKQGYEPADESNPRLRQAPIYEYAYGSLMRKYKSTRMRTGAEKEILIGVNNTTGDAFGVEDKKNYERLKIMLMFFAYFGLAFIVFIVFLMARNG